MGNGSNSSHSAFQGSGGIVMDDNEKEAVMETLQLAKMAIVAMLLAAGYLQREILIGML